MGKVSAYKLVECKGSVESISDAFSELESLAEEMREIADNMEDGGMGHMPKAEAAGEAADTLEGLTEPEVPSCLEGRDTSWHESVNRRKGRGPSRAVRCSNACAVFRAAADSAMEWAESCDDEDEKQAAEEFADECNAVADEAEGVEFPGMYG